MDTASEFAHTLCYGFDCFFIVRRMVLAARKNADCSFVVLGLSWLYVIYFAGSLQISIPNEWVGPLLLVCN